MKSFSILLLCLLFAAAVPSYAQSYAQPQASTTASSVTSTATVTVNYGDGTSMTADGQTAGIESTTHSPTGNPLISTFSGVFNMDGKTYAMPPTKGSMRGTLRFYRFTFRCENKTYRVLVMLGHPQAPVFTSVSVSDGNDSTNFGYGSGHS